MITTESLSVAVKQKVILENISFSVPKNSFCAILGKNGSGKSTLLKAVVSNASNDLYTGDIFIDGINLRNYKTNSLSKKVSYLPQQLPSPNVTVYELVSYGRSPYHGLDLKLSEKDRSIIELALDKCGCKSFSERLVSSLSGGEKQKAFLAMNMAQDTDIMLLDEPTSDMDMGAQDEFLSLLKQMTFLGKTVIAVLHDINGALKYADEFLILDKGKSVFAGSKENCLQSKTIENTFGIKKYTLPNGSDVFLA